MKKWLIPASIIVVLMMGTAVMLTKETNEKYVISNTGAAFDYLWQKEPGIQPSGKMVTIPLDRHLLRLENHTDSDVTQVCGDDGSSSITLDAALLAVLDQEELKYGIVTTPQNAQINQQMPNITINTGSTVNEISNQGTGNIKVNCPNNDKFVIENLGTGNVKVSSVGLVALAEVNNKGTGSVFLGAYQFKSVNVDNRGTGSVSFFNNVESATVVLYGVGDVTFINAPKITSTVKGLGSIKTNTPWNAYTNPLN
jgi:hypothetical protein